MISKRDRDILVKEIVERWFKDEQKFKRLEGRVNDFLEREISSIELLPTISHRVKSLMSIVKTAVLKNKKYDDLNDKLGFRIVCHFKSQLPVVKRFLEGSFVIRHYESKQKGLKFDTLGYASDHYDVSIREDLPQFSDFTDLHELVFEIQVRTICQHAWADVEHSLSYKQEANLPDDVKRRIFRLTSLLEICDDEFDSVNDYLLKLPESKAFAILLAVEGKFYRYARRSYDRDLSVETIATLLEGSRFGNNSHELVQTLVAFLRENESRIEYIYNERREQLEKDYFLSQPEVLFIWFLIEKHQHELIPAWREQFDVQDLRDLSVIWGTPITLPE